MEMNENFSYYPSSSQSAGDRAADDGIEIFARRMKVVVFFWRQKDLEFVILFIQKCKRIPLV